MSGLSVNPAGKYGETLVGRTYDWVGKAWRVLPRTAMLFEPMIGDLIDSAKRLKETLHGVKLTDARVPMQTELESLRRSSVKGNLWGVNTKFFDVPFFELNDPGLKEGFLAILLASIIADNLENPPNVFSKSKEKDLKGLVDFSEECSTRYWLQTAWQSRFPNLLPESNVCLKWDETVSVIRDSVREIIGDKQIPEINDTDLDNLRRAIHAKMRERKLWRDDVTGQVFHDVDFDRLRYSDNPRFALPFMQDNYTVLALVGLIAKSDYKIVD